MSSPELQLEALKMVEGFSKWMMVVQAGLLGTYSRWVTTGSISPTRTAKALTFVGFGGALVLASLRLGFLSDMAQRIGTTSYISELGISHFGLLQNVPMWALGVPQHVFFFAGIIGFAWSAWSLRQNGTDEK